MRLKWLLCCYTFQSRSFNVLKSETVLLLLHIHIRGNGIIIIATWTRPNLCSNVAYHRLEGISTNQLRASYEYKYPSKHLLSIYWIVLLTWIQYKYWYLSLLNSNHLWAEFHRRPSVECCSRSSNSNTGVGISGTIEVIGLMLTMSCDEQCVAFLVVSHTTFSVNRDWQQIAVGLFASAD